MYCPQCGREFEPDGDARFCRYCGFFLNDTKDTLRGYTEVRRGGYKYANLSYILLLVLFWIQYFNLIPWQSVWGGNFWLISILGFIFGLWFMGNRVADKPAKYVKRRKDEETTPEIAWTERNKELPPSRSIPVAKTGKDNVNTPEMAAPPSATEHTTQHLSDIHNS